MCYPCITVEHEHFWQGTFKPHEWSKLSDVLTDISHMITVALLGQVVQSLIKLTQD